ncbi:MAG: tripartite tricarboxylate transporter substrate binding protein [Betaproteobacteria bacterium]|nr:tripartite tricarboxylate transporter substrate binding protein [Betaproteobacteria bacterium]
MRKIVNKIKYLHIFIATTAALAAGAPLAQEAYPARPVRLIVPLPPGTATDFIARTLAAPLTEQYKQPVVVDNRPGAGGLIGSSLGAKATPDGYTLVMVAPPHTMAALLNANPPYHPVKDFTPVAGVALVPNLLVVSPKLPAKSVKELVALLQANPGKYNFASVGVGSLAHIAGELFNRAANTKQVHVPFKLLGDAFGEAINDRVHYFLFTIPSASGIVREGRLRALATSGSRRSPAWPDLPTVGEAGLPEATSDGWFGLVGPAATPGAVVKKLSADVSRLLADAKMKETLLRGGAEVPADTSTAVFAKLMQTEYERYTRLVKEAGLKAQ